MRPGPFACRLRNLLLGLALPLAPVLAQEETGGAAPAPLAPVELTASHYAALTKHRALARRLKAPLLAGRDVGPVLTLMLAGRKQVMDAPDKARALFEQGLALMAETETFPALPATDWPAKPNNVQLELLEEFTVPADIYDYAGLGRVDGCSFQAAAFTVDGLKQYGVVVRPAQKGKYPLLLYLHGAAFGVPDYSLPWLAHLARRGYVIVAPAFRGEPLFAGTNPALPDYECEGKIENLLGEVNDALGMVDGARRLPAVKPGRFGIVGHSFGSGAGLLAAARSDQVACVVSYDAWLTNPFRFYWERLANEFERSDRNYLWGSWPAFCRRPVKQQLHGLKARSIVHNARGISAPVLLFTGGAYSDSAYHASHEDLTARLEEHGAQYEYHVMPRGGHNFMLYYSSLPARAAHKKMLAWLQRHHPPVKPARK